MEFFSTLADHLERNRVTRRQALWLIGASCVGSLSGCATSPVTGQSILVGMSEDDERRTDTKVSPHQFSQDLGAVQDPVLNRYLADVGKRVCSISHRPQMPYSFRALNANYVNAYTFPGGAMGITRGILVELDDEAQLAALLGHEAGHVNARHAAQRQGQSMLAQVAVAGLNIATSDSRWGGLVAIGSQLGASALLSSYSRDNEREADALGQEYMVRAGYPAQGMVQLHELLIRQERTEPGLLQTMFATHPMSRERRDTARHLAATQHSDSQKRPLQRERFMDQTSGLRRLKPTIDDLKQGESRMAKKDLQQAHESFQSALRRSPEDYAANLRMAQCQQARGQTADALRYAENASRIYPQEAQAHKMAGVLALEQRDPGRAYQRFDQFERLLPGDPGTLFLKGIAQEGQGNRQAAANLYGQYLRQDRQGNAAQYAASRLQNWGYLK